MKKIGIWIIIIVVIGAAVLFFIKKHKSRAKQNGYPTVQVEYGNIEVKVLSTGTIEPYTRVEIKAPVSGTIDKVVTAEGNKVRAGAVLAWMSSEERINLISSAQSNLTEAQKSGDENLIKEAKDAYDIAQQAYKPVPILTSMSGEVIKRDCEPGQNVTTQTVLLVISDKLVADVSVDEADIRNINIGFPAKIVLDAFSDIEVTGKIAKISYESKLVSNVNIYDVMVVPDTIPEYWRSGMTANVNFILQSKENVLTLPLSVINERKGSKGTSRKSTNHAGRRGRQEQGAGINMPKHDTTGTHKRNNKYVLLLENGKPVERDVKTGLSDGSNIEIINGLKEGDNIIFQIETSSQAQNNPSRSRQMMRMMPH